MQWHKDEDGTLVSSPVYLTMSPAVVELMEKCKHRYVEDPNAPTPEPLEPFSDCTTVCEKCQCGAIRFRVAGPEDQINELFHLR